MAKKKLTKNQMLYKKEVNRIKRAMKRVEKEGFILTSNFLPDTPTRVTRAKLEEIRRITPNYIRNRSMYRVVGYGEVPGTLARKAIAEAKSIMRKTGETSQEVAILRGIEGRTQTFGGLAIDWENVQAAAQAVKLYYADLVYQQIMDEYGDSPGRGGKIIRDILYSQIRKYGFDHVLESIAEAPSEFIEACRKVSYYVTKGMDEEAVSKHYQQIRHLLLLLYGDLPATKQEAAERDAQVEAIVEDM